MTQNLSCVNDSRGIFSCEAAPYESPLTPFGQGMCREIPLRLTEARRSPSMVPSSKLCRCSTCGTKLKGSIFRIAREWRRMHYLDDEPEHEFWDADSIEIYCSLHCLQLRLPLVMAREGIPLRPPGKGPIGLCSQCRGIVDMSKPHLGYSSEKDNGGHHGLLEGVAKLDIMAVLCPQCVGT